ncbi:helix-turn-helix domain-containing protein [Deinococcus marmoris]|uniref:helix-turn-helix domain-containing protein n=1 Tax=Deinococcus marmoris TaxID=249408 RepID=UPI0012DC6442|nr:helix-turn-helix transcriptional regulator [Deinococcus marmoris]
MNQESSSVWTGSVQYPPQLPLTPAGDAPGLSQGLAPVPRNHVLQPLSSEQAGQLLRRRRQALGLSAQAVVDATAMPRVQYLSHLERGGVHAARSQYWPALQAALKLSGADVAAIEGQDVERKETIPDVRYPLPESALVQGTGTQAYQFGPDVLLVDHTQCVLERGREYLVLVDGNVVRGRVVEADPLAVVVQDRMMPGVQVLGRVTYMGRSV